MTFHKRSLLFLFSLVLFSLLQLTAQDSPCTSYQVGFYNVENLFDLIDDPVKLDEEFTPLGKKKWTEERYREKMEHLDRVIGAMGYPDILGLCEVENEAVLQDLIRTNGMIERTYAILHTESPDARGIDVALLYNSAVCQVLNHDYIRIEFPIEVVPDEPGYTSRDILHAQLLFLGRDTLDVYVNHWPSRYGGLEKSQPKRVHVANHLRVEIDELLEQRPQAKIIIIGDLNDEPDNISVQKVLGALMPGDAIHPNLLYNLMAVQDAVGYGTYNYRGNWNMLDQIIVSGNLLNPKAKLQVLEPRILLRPWMLYKHDRFGYGPTRSYGGPNYYGGYSDHLPVSVTLYFSR